MGILCAVIFVFSFFFFFFSESKDLNTYLHATVLSGLLPMRELTFCSVGAMLTDFSSRVRHHFCCAGGGDTHPFGPPSLIFHASFFFFFFFWSHFYFTLPAHNLSHFAIDITVTITIARSILGRCRESGLGKTE